MTHLFDAWSEVTRRAGNGPRLAVFTDFDGTLAPIRRRATQAQLSQRVRRALERLTADGHLIAVVSGRPLEDLEARVGIAGVWYAGSHGYFLRAPDGAQLSLLRLDERRRIVRVGRRLAAALESMPGVTVEPKPGAVAIHYRAATPTVRQQVGAAVRGLLGTLPGLRLWPGRMVWEVLPAGPVDKYLATRFILRAARQRDPRPIDCPLYLGDDVSDEQVFVRWTGISVAVGRRARSATAAHYFVRSPAEVADCLERLDDLYKTSRQRGEAENAPRINPTWE
jgi:trehalose-phosphatase